MLKRRNHFRRLTIPFLGLICLTLLFSFGIYRMTGASAASAQTAGRELGFKSVFITGGDTLWSIAQENYSGEYGSLKNYIKEIKRCNSLPSDRINAGSSLIVPVYLPD